jgi:hypothetical protein
VVDVSSEEDSEKPGNLKPPQTDTSKDNLPISVRKQQFRDKKKNKSIESTVSHQ